MGPAMRWDGTYAAVASFEMYNVVSEDSTIRGIAYPDSGSKPCALGIWSDDRLSGIAEALSYDAVAASSGVRHGWCGYHVTSLGRAALGANYVFLKCMKTKKVFAWWSASEIADVISRVHRVHIKIEQMLGDINNDGISTSIEQIMPFVVATIQYRGNEDFLNASWKYFLERSINNDEIIEWVSQDYRTKEQIMTLFNALISSPECVLGREYRRPGPFQAGFPFHTANFDETRRA